MFLLPPLLCHPYIYAFTKPSMLTWMLPDSNSYWRKNASVDCIYKYYRTNLFPRGKNGIRERALSLGHRPVGHRIFFLLKHLLRGKLVYLLHSKLAGSLSSLAEKPTRGGSEAPANSQHPGQPWGEPSWKYILQCQTSLLTAASGDPEPELPIHTAPAFPTQGNREGYSMMLAVVSASGLDDLLCSNRQITHPLIAHMLPLYFENPINSTVWAMGTLQ